MVGIQVGFTVSNDPAFSICRVKVIFGLSSGFSELFSTLTVTAEELSWVCITLNLLDKCSSLTRGMEKTIPVFVGCCEFKFRKIKNSEMQFKSI